MTLWLVVGALGVAALVALAEIGSRWWLRHRSKYHVWPPHARIEMQMDADAFPELEPRCRFYINADGERGGDVRAGEPGLYRVLVAGGSAVECFALDQPSSWPGNLERLLNAPGNLAVLGGRRVHVGNIGHSGVGSAELEIILDRVLPQYSHLDAILIMVGASDVYHWLEEGASPARAPSCVAESLLFAEHPQLKITQVIDMRGDPRVTFDRTTEIMEKGVKVDAFVCLTSISGPEVAEVLGRKNVTGASGHERGDPFLPVPPGNRGPGHGDHRAPRTRSRVPRPRERRVDERDAAHDDRLA